MPEQEQGVRKHDIDNLRSLAILLLFPVHTFMIWNDFGTKFYIWVADNRIFSTAIVLINPWFMPLLFVLAGMSARYALHKRTVREFVMQRVRKLLIPFLCGMVMLVPFQTYYARKYFQHYEGGILENIGYFFTHITDLSGYDGAFTPGHLWFILFLFVISMLALLIFRFLPYEKFAAQVQKMPAAAIFFLFVPVWLMYYVGNFGGYSIGKNLTLYLIGYYVLSDDSVAEKLRKNGKWLAAAGILSIIGLAVLYYCFSYYGDLWVNYAGWSLILALLVFGRKFLNRRTKFTVYFNQASYPIYLLHQSILVALAYCLVPLCNHTALLALGICAGSFILTVAAYHLIKRIPVVRQGIGLR